MDYQRIYNQLVKRAQNRTLEGYKEKHHILSKCLGGDNSEENLVELTAREHFLCHMLLCEIYPNDIKLYHALWMMSNIKKRKNFQYKDFISSRQYEKLKIKRSLLLKEQWYKKRKDQGLIINKDYINKFKQIYPNIILSENDKHCINYCYNNNLNVRNIICKCNKGIKRFQNYTQGYKQYCSQKCANLCNKEKSLQTKENNGLWDNSKERLRKKEIENLSKEEIEILRRNKIRDKHKGKSKNGNSRGKFIIQFDDKDNFIKEWPSIRQAGFELKGNQGEPIRKCLKGLQKTAYGYIWKYKE
jgi:hypothetical protein